MPKITVGFTKQVDKLAMESSKQSISFSGPEESAYILGTLFKHAKEYVKMYVGNFNGDISNDEYYSQQVNSFLQRGNKLEVIANDTNPVPSEVYKAISLYAGFKDNVVIKQTEDRILVDEDNNPLHFAVADDKMYRIEIDIKNYVGIVCFNDCDISLNLSKVFDDAFMNKISV